jgi:hypothetical protein
MSSARASKTICLTEFVLWFENLLRNILRDERSKIVKKSDFYQTKNQHELNIFLRKCMQIFEIRLVTYRRDLDRVQYAQMWLTNDIFDVWYRKYESMNENLSWKLFKETLQKHFASQRLRIINMKQKLKELKQRLTIHVAVVCAFEQFRESTLKAISRKSTCESFVLRITFLHSWRNHIKTWKLHDENANREDSLVNRANWIESRHVKSISSKYFSKSESIEILNHDEQILRTRIVSTFQLNWRRTRIFFCVERIKSKISNFDSF